MKRIVLALITFAVLCAPPAHAGQQDESYLEYLVDNGLNPKPRELYIKAAHHVCDTMARDRRLSVVLAALESDLPNLDEAAEATVIGAAIGIYCPQYDGKIRPQ